MLYMVARKLFGCQGILDGRVAQSLLVALVLLGGCWGNQG